jgi:heme/copper-type cytochrome/quinol oxidase subunit 3
MTRSTVTEVISMYWHFMDALWVFIFLLLFLGR